MSDPAEAGGTGAAELQDIARQLQAQVDQLVARNAALERRIANLERDRATLRDRLANQQRAAPRWMRRLTGRRTRAPAPSQTPPSANHDRSIVVPDGVGRIPDLELPTSSPRRPTLRVAAVLDPFSEAAFAPEFDLVPTAASGWRETLEASPPHLLLVESAFTGPSGSWAHRVARYGPPSTELRDLVAWCRERGIPTVFWNKEDPPNFRWFISSAGLFDWVFTVDETVVPRYQRELGHERVGVLPFAAQPALHHPGVEARSGRVAFAGTYYAAKHPERVQQIELVVDPARAYGLHIFDRMGTRADERFRWPERFQPHIVGSLTYAQVVEVYRRYRVVLNVNTVTTSPTMCARRIFEAAACGAPVVTGPSLAVDRMVPPEAIQMVRSPDETRIALDELLNDESAWQARSDAAQRWVLAGHTYSHRVDQVLSELGMAD